MKTQSTMGNRNVAKLLDSLAAATGSVRTGPGLRGTKLPSGRKRVTPHEIGDGQKRAAARLNAKREANADIPSAYKYTRQQDRARMRAMKKELRASRKAFMKEERFPGGPAVVR